MRVVGFYAPKNDNLISRICLIFGQCAMAGVTLDVISSFIKKGLRLFLPFILKLLYARNQINIKHERESSQTPRRTAGTLEVDLKFMLPIYSWGNSIMVGWSPLIFDLKIFVNNGK